MGKRTSQKKEHYYKWDILFVKCSCCEEFKPSEDFVKSKNRSFGLDCYCKECTREKWKKFYKDNRDKVRRAHEEYYQNNKGSILERHREYNRRTYTTEKAREYQRRYKEKNYDKLIQKNKDARKKMLKEGNRPNREREKKMDKKFWYSTTLFHNRAASYIKKNDLRPKECMACGKAGDIEFHHPLYDNIDKRKEWIFLCRGCHKLVHTWELNCPESVDLIQLNAHMPTILTDKDLEYTDAEAWLY